MPPAGAAIAGPICALACFALALLGDGVGGLRVVDLTHSFSDLTHHWPTVRGFKLKPQFAGKTDAGFFYAANDFEQSEHAGTHIDAPYHFSLDRWKAADIPIERMVARGVVVDVRAKVAAAGADYLLSVDDLRVHESAHGVIPAATIVLVNFGWARRWGDYEAYFGTPAKNVSLLHFPGIGVDAAEYLVLRGIYGVGVDTPSTDFGQSKDFKTHQILGAANVFAIENVAHLDSLPAVGGAGAVTVHAAVQKISGGSGGPVRLYAIVDDGEDVISSITNQPTSFTTAFMVLAIIVLGVLNLVQAYRAKKQKAV